MKSIIGLGGAVMFGIIIALKRQTEGAMGGCALCLRRGSIILTGEL